jgi:hypothetical protein
MQQHPLRDLARKIRRISMIHQAGGQGHEVVEHCCKELELLAFYYETLAKDHEQELYTDKEQYALRLATP